ncbi:hypothetical protein AXK58_16535 [Tsukamurella tyrosinosolvens]|nr:MlaD family protein [Tsukamurella tyrosinosolvens]KXO93435.1 hypothetical protein AXK58_16535 [Tsukamurella tyrosinosolvens]
MTTEPDVLVRRGAIAVAVLLVLALLWWGLSALLRPDPMRITLLTSSVAPGINSGTVVEMNGVQIGTVKQIGQDGSGRLGIAIDLTPYKVSGLTDAFTADFAPNNLFGITSIQITPSTSGRPVRNGARIQPAAAPADSTMSGLLRALADVESTAFRPYMSDLLRQADTASKGLLPLVRALGALAQANAETQTVPTSRTLPILASALRGIGASTDDVLTSLKLLWDWRGPDTPGYAQSQTASIAALQKLTAPDLAQLFASLRPLAPTLSVLVDLERRATSSMPDAARNGQQVSDLIETLRRAIKDTPSGKVLDLDVQAKPVAVAPGQSGGRR